jgi:hypothetical protein
MAARVTTKTAVDEGGDASAQDDPADVMTELTVLLPTAR